MALDRKTVIAGGVVVVAVLAVWALGSQRRAAFARSVPAWLDVHQPPENIAAQLPTVSEAESWAAARCRPPACCSPAYTAGMRVRRLYPETLAASPHSSIRASFEVGGGY